jgi:hypothetical protein
MPLQAKLVSLAGNQMKVEAREVPEPVCDKCGKPVPKNNDATVLDTIVQGVRVNDFVLMFATPRHLLPTEDCPGSPSRAQYLYGQPRDERGSYGYKPEHEDRIRTAFALMQQGVTRP